jgi:hypothetical protein
MTRFFTLSLVRILYDLHSCHAWRYFLSRAGENGKRDFYRTFSFSPVGMSFANYFISLSPENSECL